MHKLIPAALAMVVLSGCGAAAGPFAPKSRAGVMQAQSAAGAAKGVRAMYKAAFKAADKNGNGHLTLDELPAAMPQEPVPGAAPGADPQAAQKALMDRLDVNKDKKVGYREFLSKDNIAAATAMFRFEAGKAFSFMDKDGSRLLVAAEMAGAPVAFEVADLNKNGKVTLSEFEDAFAATLAGGAEPPPGPAPVPAPPAPPAPAPGEDPQPAPPAPAPGEDPQPAPPAPAPGGEEPPAPPAPAYY